MVGLVAALSTFLVSPSPAPLGTIKSGGPLSHFQYGKVLCPVPCPVENALRMLCLSAGTELWLLTEVAVASIFSAHLSMI